MTFSGGGLRLTGAGGCADESAALRRVGGELRRTLAELPDKRTGSNTQYSMETTGLIAFSVFFTQCPSFLAHQKAMDQRKRQSNARTLS